MAGDPRGNAGDAEVGAEPLDDGELVTLARAGDVHAYEALIQRYQAVVHRIAYLVTGVAADADEVGQDAFVKAWYALDRFRPDAPFRPWLLRIVVNEARNRRAWARRRFALPLEGVTEEAADPADSPENAAMAAARRRDLASAVRALSRPDQLVIACRFFLELSEAETAQVLGTRPGTVKSRLSRALGRLRAGIDAGAGPDLLAAWRES